MEFTHIANPVRVTAQVIREVSSDRMGHYLKLEDGNGYTTGPEMTSRHTPVPGDYLVTQEDGYIYINPKDVFERKYRAIGAQMVGMDSDKTTSPAELSLRHTALEYASRHYEAGSAGVVNAADAYYQFLKGAA